VDQCIFCGESFGGSRPRSKEHAAPKWAGKLLPSKGQAHQEVLVETSEGQRRLYRGLRNPFTTVCSDVCKPCNEGWMEELEGWAEQWLARPIQGQTRALHFWRQAAAATWAAKTAMVWDAVEPDRKEIPAEVLRAFHALQSASIRQRVWIGRYRGDHPHPYLRSAAHVLGASDAVDAHSYLAAVGIGELVFIVFGHLLATRESVFALPSEQASKLIQVWPPIHEVVNWPPSDSLDDAALDAIVRSLGEPIKTKTPAPEP
jgi:hypothetical protein